MTAEPRAVEEIDGLAPGRIPIDELVAAQRPAILKGVAAGWPLV